MRRFLCLLWLCAGAAFSAAPTVTKVDPPNWWLNHSINPVRVLIRGSGLNGAQAAASDPGIDVRNVRTNDKGTYLFADVQVNSIGRHAIQLSTSEGTARAGFEVLAPLVREGRFQGFSPADSIYLIMPDRFANGDPSNDNPDISPGLLDRSKPRYYHGGDLQGIINHLPYLKDLGITALWINPIWDNVNHLNQKEVYDGQAITDYHGYGAVDFYGIEEHFGTFAKFRELVDKAHASDIKIILDMVENHTGPYHPWVQDSPLPNWFHGTVNSHLKESWQTWTLEDPHSPAELRSYVLDGWFIDLLPDLNQEEPEVSRYLIQNTLWWVGTSGIDGIRQDTLPYVSRAFWRDWMAAIKREYPNLRVVGEMFDGDPALVSFFQGGRQQADGIDSGVDTLFDFPLYFTLRRVFASGASITELPRLLSHDSLYPAPERLVTFLGLHDVQRFINEKGATTAGMKLAFTFLFTTRGIPMVYYGDEIGLPGGDDPDNRRDFPGGWPDDPRNAFTVEGRTPDQREIFDHVRRLARLRQETPDLQTGKLTELAVTDSTYAYMRGNLLIALNNGANPGKIDVPVARASWRDALGALGNIEATEGRLRFTLPPRSAAIFAPR